MSVFSTLNGPLDRRSRYQSASTTQIFKSIPSLMVNDQMIYQNNGTNIPVPRTLDNRRNIRSVSSNLYQNIPNSNNSSIRRVNQQNVIKTLPKSVFSNPTMSRSFDDLTLLRSNTINRRSVALDGVNTNADPELKNIKKTGASYHVSVDLKANLLNGFRPATAMQLRNDSKQTTINRRSMISNQNISGNLNSEFARTDPFMLEGNRRSILNLTNLENNQLPENQFLKSRSATFPSKAVINLNAPKNNVSIATQISNKENSFSLRDGYIIKSLKPSDIKREVQTQQILKNNNVDFDLCLYGTMVQQPENNITINSQIVDIKPNNSVQYEQTTQSRTTTRAVNESDEPFNEKPTKKKFEPKSRRAKMPINEIPENSNPVVMEDKPAKKKTPAKKTTATTTTTTESINTEPTTLPKSLNTDPEKDSKEIQTLSTKNKLIQTDYFSDPDEYIGPEYIPRLESPKKSVVFANEDETFSSRTQSRAIPMDFYVPSNTLPVQEPYNTLSDDEFDGYENNIPPSVLTNLQTNYDLSDEENIMYRRLMKNAPEGSLKQNINVEDRYVNLLGPYSEDQVREKYEKKEINVDHVAQRVELTVNNGMVTIKLQLTFQKTVPYKNTENTFKQTTLIVNKIIIVDLTVTDERRQIYQEVLQNHKNGRLDKVYTWKLYKIFSAMALADKGMGLNKEHVSIEKKVEEDKKLNLNGTDFLDYQTNDASFKNLDKKAAEMGVGEMYGANFDETMRSLSQSGMDMDYGNSSRSRSYEWNNNNAINININKGENSNDKVDNNYYNSGSNYMNTGNDYNSGAYYNSTSLNQYGDGGTYEYSSQVSNIAGRSVSGARDRNLLVVDNNLESRLNQVKNNINDIQNGLMTADINNNTWKSSYGKWLSTDGSGMRANRIGHRFDVYHYLRPGGSRNYNIQMENNMYNTGVGDTGQTFQAYNFQNENMRLDDKTRSDNLFNKGANMYDIGTGSKYRSESNEHKKRMDFYASQGNRIDNNAHISNDYLF